MASVALGSGTTTPSSGPTGQYTPNQIADVAIKAGFPRDQIPTAVAVAMAESGGKLTALNDRPPDLSYGLWQINMIGALGPARRAQFGISSNEALFGSATNARAAKIIWNGGGWNAWSTYKNGAYRAFIVVGTVAAMNPTNTDDPTNGGTTDTGTSVIVGGKIPDVLQNFIDAIIKALSPFFLRASGFVGGGILVVLAILLYVKSKGGVGL
jgi:hypothetical protein